MLCCDVGAFKVIDCVILRITRRFWLGYLGGVGSLQIKPNIRKYVVD